VREATNLYSTFLSIMIRFLENLKAMINFESYSTSFTIVLLGAITSPSL
jgi:hypothetical protein